MKKIAFIDFEMNTNGDMDKDDLEIIEVGLVRLNVVDNVIDKEFESIVFPITKNRIMEYTTYLTGIKTKDLDKAMDIHKMIGIISFMARDCDYVYCWGEVDMRCLQNCLKKSRHHSSEIEEQFIKKIRNLQEDKILPNKFRKKNLHEWGYENGIIAKNQTIIHSALPDAKLLCELYRNEKKN